MGITATPRSYPGQAVTGLILPTETNMKEIKGMKLSTDAIITMTDISPHMSIHDIREAT